MRGIIRQFDGTKYSFLSNFYTTHIFYNGLEYNNSEAAFQAQKTLDLKEREKFQFMTASESKSAGRRCKLRKDWEKIKDKIMYEVVKAKFEQNNSIKDLLLSTGNSELIEGTTWNDRYWGVDLYSGIGLNHLGLILEKVREDLGGWKRDYEEENWMKNF